MHSRWHRHARRLSAAARRSNRRSLRATRYDQLARVMLREGAALAEVGKPLDAILTLEQVIAEYPRTAYASEAQYRIGYVYEVDMDNFDEAQKAYGKVAEQGRSSFTEDAARRARTVGAVKTLMSAATDSLSMATATAAEGRFLRANSICSSRRNRSARSRSTWGSRRTSGARSMLPRRRSPRRGCA
jgi:tetratricopeptide (TPR) repeat protein